MRRATDCPTGCADNGTAGGQRRQPARDRAGQGGGGVWEMKLYAVVDKKSGVRATETVDLESITLYGLKETAVRRRRESDMMETSDIVAVELKEVAGPCEWCGVLNYGH